MHYLMLNSSKILQELKRNKYVKIIRNQIHKNIRNLYSKIKMIDKKNNTRTNMITILEIDLLQKILRKINIFTI